MPLAEYKGITPTIGKGVFIAPTAWVTGDVLLADDVSLFFGATIRGDINQVRVGRGTNLQENVMVHTSTGLGDCIIGSEVTVGHGAIVHGCTVGDGCLIGMNSTILDNAEIGAGSIIGAQALVPMNMKIPPRSLVLGVPGKVVRPVSTEELQSIQDGTIHYIEVGAEYRRTINPGTIEPEGQ